MNNDAIPEFDTRNSIRRLAESRGYRVDVADDGIERVYRPDGTLAVTARPPVKHHPNCAECCAMGRCHWCLTRPESGTLTSAGPDGFVYSACRAHLQYFAEAQRQENPSAGLDLTAGLAHLDIAALSPLTR